ncbi:MAG: flagellar FliJ protein [Rhodothermales bacterium]|jgi:flagellar FliJ protein
MLGNKFQFRLETVLKLRRLEAEQAKARLAKALGDVASCRETLQRDEEELNSLLSRAAAGNVVNDLRRFAEMRSAAMDRCATVRQRMVGLQQSELKARHALGARMRDEQALEDLRTKQLADFVEARQQREQKALDEMGLIGFGRTQSTLQLPCE